jgi:hypothetical protein
LVAVAGVLPSYRYDQRMLTEALLEALSDQRAEYRFFHRDFFAFDKEVSSGIWLRPEATLGKINVLFH